MKLFILFGLLTCNSMIAQMPINDPEFSSIFIQCMFTLKDHEDMNAHLRKCMKNRSYPKFRLNDWNNDLISLSNNNDVQIFTFWDLDDDFEKEKILIEKLKSKYKSIKIVAFIKNDICVISEKFQAEDLKAWHVIPEFENKKVMLSQYGWPMTFILNPNGTILDFHLSGLMECKNINSVEDLLKLFYDQ
jgi:hypothetical protein